jgi:predicted DsbA family dithiol-disulfide isomerase
MRNMTRTTRRSHLLLIAILALSGCGAWLNSEMLKQQDDLWGQGHAAGLIARMCEVTQQWGFNCATATKGAWANVRMPVLAWSGGSHVHLARINVPVAFIGLAYFVFLAVWFAFVGRPRAFGRRWYFVPIAAVALGACGSLFYLAVMAFMFAPWCAACVLIHLINFMIVAAVGSLCRCKAPVIIDETATHPEYPPAVQTLTAREALGAIAFSLVLIVGLWEYRGEHLALRDQWRKLLPYKSLVTTLSGDRDFLLREYYAEPRQATISAADESALDNRPRLDVFTDYECPNCACRTSGIISQARAAFGDDLQIMIRHYPRCRECTPAVKSEFHKSACLAAYAAEAARLQGGDATFWTMHNRLLRYPDELDRNALRVIAGQIGLDQEQFLSDLQSDAVRKIVAAHVLMGRQWGVTGTPTLFINGRRVNQNFEGPTYWQVVAEDWTATHGNRLTFASPNATALAATPSMEEKE